jgi:HD-like signal output (HDOD) protein
MANLADYTRLELLFKRASALPALPATAMQLVSTIDSGHASAMELERIIVKDPALTADFIRLAAVSSQGYDGGQYSTVRGAILLLGQRAVRSLATSLILRSLMNSGETSSAFNRERFSSHSLASGLIARFLFARKARTSEMSTKLSADELFAAGLLSDLAFGLLAKVAPEVYQRVYGYGKRSNKSLNEAFLTIHGKPAAHLAAAAAEAWGLPPMFGETFRYMDAPWEHDEEFSAMCCLKHADTLANSFGLSIEDWQLPSPSDLEVEEEVGIPEEERAALEASVVRMVQSYAGTFAGTAAGRRIA